MSSDSKIEVRLLSSIVYVTQPNTLLLRMVNQTGAPIPLAAGAPQNPPPPGGPFGVLVYFDKLYAVPGGDSDLSIKAGGWAATYFPPSPRFSAWALAPSSNGIWRAGDAIEFTVAGLEPTARVGTHYLGVTLCNLNGSPEQPFSQPVQVANPPDRQKHSLRDSVSISLGDQPTVSITKRADEPAPNSLVLSLMNTNPNQALVPPGVPWDDANPPQFTLSFQYAEPPGGSFALTDTNAADQFEVGIFADPSMGWNPPTKADGPSWLLMPGSQNQAILGTGSDGMVQFSIDDVITQLVAGPTLLYLQYQGIPGYNDGYLTCLLDKVYRPVGIKSFEINQTTFPVKGLQPSTAYLNWEVENAVLVELFPHGIVGSHAQAFPVVVGQNQTLVLTAIDPILGTIVSQSVAVGVDPPVVARWLPCGTITPWVGAVSTVPKGFALCDGGNGTPDLRDRFVVGASLEEPPGTSGRSTHTHLLDGFRAESTTSTYTTHDHLMPKDWNQKRADPGTTFSGINTNTKDSSDPWPSHNQEAGAHHHRLTVKAPSVPSAAAKGGLRPAWYALCYIMKLYPAS